MENIIHLNPASILFYCLGIIMPTIMLLYNFGYLVFTLGEYKENKKNIPLLTIYLIVKIFVIGFIMFFMYHIVFDIFIKQFSFIEFYLIGWGLLISVDTIFINKILKMLPTLRDEHFNTDLDNKCTIMFSNNKWLFYFKTFLLAFIGIMSIINLFSSFDSILTILFFVYLLINYQINKQIKGLRHGNDTNV